MTSELYLALVDIPLIKINELKLIKSLKQFTKTTMPGDSNFETLTWEQWFKISHIETA